MRQSCWTRFLPFTLDTRGTTLVSRGHSVHPYHQRRRQSQSNTGRRTEATIAPSTRRVAPPPPRPTVVYESNHLLAVYKPPGWHSIPHASTGVVGTAISADANDDGVPVMGKSATQSKCLVTYLKDQRLGGGSQGTFLNPLHRIDQPCSGVLLLGKTSKAASRIQTQWRKGTIHKLYYVVVHCNGNDNSTNRPLEQYDDGHANTSWRTLQGDMMRRRRDNERPSRRQRQRHHHQSVPKGWSVQMRPVSSLDESLTDRSISSSSSSFSFRRCTLEYRVVSKRHQWHTGGHSPLLKDAAERTDIRLLQIQTRQGARHMIRALLSCHGWTIMGDVRYSQSSSSSSSSSSSQTHTPMKPLWDASVALHASSIQLPNELVLGETSTLQHTFSAPIPETWFTLFGWAQSDVEQWEEYCRRCSGAQSL